MILFRPEHVQLILSGQKVETRRIWDRPRAKIGSVHLAKTQMLSKEYFAKLEILNVTFERLYDITDEGAWAEGYSTRLEYLQKFFEINKLPMSNYEVFVVKFRVVT